MPLPLEGVRVVDFSRVLAGPHCAKTLLDLGAEVIKLEPPGGDLSRKAFPSQGQVSGYYAQQNAGKRNVSIDLNAPGAREAALRLCDTADVIVENFRPGALASFGLGYESVSARNPGVVYASISGYGQHGAWRSRMAYAPTVQAETGITANTADHFERTGALRSDSLSHADVYSGLHAAIAILACLTERARTGRGQYIDVAMAAVMLSINERVHADLSDAELGAERPILGATDGPFFTGPHGERFASPMSLVGSMSFPFYLAAMRRPDLGRDPRFRTPELRLRNLDALHRIVQEWIWTFADMESLDAQLDEAKIATGQVRSVREFADSDWAREWNAVRAVSDRSGGEIKIPGRPWHFADQVAADKDQLAARQGEHNAEVLSELGFSAAEIAALEASGALEVICNSVAKLDRMNREFSEWPCSLARAVGVFGDSWTLLIVRDGLQGLTRFDEFQRSLNIARNTLSDRLGKLVDAGVMTKRFYQDNPPRYEYLLTDMGRDFFPVLAAMLSWGDKWLDDGAARRSPCATTRVTAKALTRLSPRSFALSAASPSCTPASSSASVPGTPTTSGPNSICAAAWCPPPSRGSTGHARPPPPNAPAKPPRIQRNRPHPVRRRGLRGPTESYFATRSCIKTRSMFY